MIALATVTATINAIVHSAAKCVCGFRAVIQRGAWAYIVRVITNPDQIQRGAAVKCSNQQCRKWLEVTAFPLS